MRELLAGLRRKHNREREDIRVDRRGAGRLVRAVLAHFSPANAAARNAKAALRVAFEGEAGVDEGGLSKEMLRLFFEVR